MLKFFNVYKIVIVNAVFSKIHNSRQLEFHHLFSKDFKIKNEFSSLK